MGLFAKAADKKKVAAPKAAKKQTTWVVGATNPEGEKVAKSVSELVKLHAESKTIDAKMGVHKNVISTFAFKNYINDYATLGVPPETPMLVQNNESGEKVTYAAQDRSSQYKVKDEQIDALVGLLGADAAADLTYEETSFGFNRDVLAIPGVQAAIEKALEKVVEKLKNDEILNDDTAERLLDVETKRSFKPGTLDRVAQICGRDTTRMSQFIDAMNSSATKYVKA